MLLMPILLCLIALLAVGAMLTVAWPSLDR
jgi:hypothetical protein